jgi:asparagine synthase (glutamine-hydrolysing)
MDRFVAFLWDPEALARQRQVELWSAVLQRASRLWTIALDRPGVKVLSLNQREGAPVVTSWTNSEGVVLGPLFERGGERNGRVRRLDARAALRVAASGGASLVQEYWGNYVAIWRDTTNRSVHVLRDPCGGTSCFMSQTEGVQLLYAHPDDIAALPNVRFTVDWTYLQAFVLFNYFVTPKTGLCEMTELLPGQRLDRSAHTDQAFAWIWHGAKIAAAPRDLSFGEAKDRLRATAEACFAAWGSEYPKIVASLSGGLDSSILVALMAGASDADVTALHYLGVGRERYEATLARRAAAHAGIRLVELEQDPLKDDVRRILDEPRLARPKVQSIAVLIDEASIQLAEETGAEAFMLGQGGDNLFLQRGAARDPFGDYVRLNGFGKGFWTTAYDTSMLQQQSIWSTLARAAASALAPAKWRPYDFLEREEWTAQRPLTSGAAEAIPEAYKLHPWFADAARLPRGKAEHLLSIVALYHYHHHHGRGIARDVIYPFFSQPIAEFALQTPTYVFCEGGIDRALERAAFADLIPPEIARRTGKGGADSYLLKVMQANLEFYRDLVLNGTLIQQGFLDRAKVETMLSPAFTAHGGGALYIYLLVAAEAWLHSWNSRAVRAAA